MYGESFYLRKQSDEENLEEDTIAFLKPVIFRDVKYIMVSATVSEDICYRYFGKENVNFMYVKGQHIKESVSVSPKINEPELSEK